jgi:hypothetical protein
MLRELGSVKALPPLSALKGINAILIMATNMKKLKIKLEYTFNVPPDTKVIEDKWHGLFILNEKYGIKSLPTIKGLKIDYENFDKNGEFENASLSYDNAKMEDFLYNSESYMVSEKTTISLGKEKYKYIL